MARETLEIRLQHFVSVSTATFHVFRRGLETGSRHARAKWYVAPCLSLPNRPHCVTIFHCAWALRSIVVAN